MISVGSLCTGYGGLDLGLALGLGVQLRHAWHVEYDPAPGKILAARFPGVPNLGDLTTLDHSSLEPVDWLTAGYPCQPFSQAGKRKGASDERHLWPFVARTIGELRPRRVLLENVAGHVALGLDAVLWDLATLGYDATWGVVRASDAGAPHRRERVFVVASNTGHADRRRTDTAGRPMVGYSGVPQRRVQGAGAPLSDSGAPAATDAAGDGRHEGRPESAGQLGRLDAAECGDDAAPDTDDNAARERREPGQQTGSRPEPAQHGHVAWGDYEPAIRRWEHFTGRPAVRPTEPGRTGERLSPRFVEWLMGLPAGWVTDVPGLARNAQLKALGNGVVPQQAALAVRLLLPVAQEVAA